MVPDTEERCSVSGGTSKTRIRDEVTELTYQKLQETQQKLNDLTTLLNELQLLTNLCQATEEGCPILEGIDED